MVSNTISRVVWVAGRVVCRESDKAFRTAFILLPINQVRALLFFPAFEGFLVEVAAFEVAGDDAVAGAEEVGKEEEDAEDKDDGGAGGNVCPEGNEEAGDGAECSEGGATPEHDIE